MSWPSFLGNKRAVKRLQAQLMEKRPLPVGLTEFNQWADRIISGARVPKNDSMKYALAYMLLDLKPTISYETDHYFISCLEKAAINQVADFYRREVYEKKQQRIAAEKAQQNSAAATPLGDVGGKVLEIPSV
jgi:hypothetical protein